MTYDQYYVGSLNWFKQGWYDAKKNTVLIVNHLAFNRSEKPNKIDSASTAQNVKKPLFGSVPPSKSTMNNTGSSFGSTRATRLDKSVTFQDIARQSLSVLKITGSASLPEKASTIANTRLLCLMELISTKRAA